MKKLLSFLSILIMFSCVETSKKPDRLLSEDQMSEILTELFIIQQSHYLSELNTPDLNMSSMDAAVIEKHGSTPEEFRENYRYYYLQPEKFKNILSGVQSNLEDMLPEKERKERMEEKEKINHNRLLPGI